MRINHNIASMNTNRALGVNRGNTQKSLEKLSSGLRINRAGDDAAGLAISEKMRGQIRGLDKASSNAQDSISLVQTAEGALNETHSILQRMRELAVQSSNDTNTDADRKELQAEVKQLTSEIDRIGNTTEFNTKKLLDGSAKGVKEAVDGTLNINNNSSKVAIDMVVTGANAAVLSAIRTSGNYNGAVAIVRVAGTSTAITAGDFKIIGKDGKTIASVTVTAGEIAFAAAAGSPLTGGATLSAANISAMAVGESITLVFGEAKSASSELDNSIMAQIGANSGQTMFISIDDMRSEAIGVDTIDISTKWGAATAIETVNNAITQVSSQRSSLGAVQNRLEHTINNLDTSSENLQASESRIRDVDMAKEMTEFTKNNILTQAAQAMLAQANQQPQSVLQLLQ
ncbi:flagellin [Ruminiclostridium sufflavum DSM 19573]|uniref:Flagellin n=1 Tax=Ruminiclostridium sufflavum DSM 19573 TaxID=1121337 RepID=A0A318XMN2_9FIRM|nr:flagellin [Ruminiclostridium sufflavum]PYG89117.1 flagellin [Ruminiclostridium sufflavum DSM 19573]